MFAPSLSFSDKLQIARTRTTNWTSSMGYSVCPPQYHVRYRLIGPWSTSSSASSLSLAASISLILSASLRSAALLSAFALSLSLYGSLALA